MNALREWRKAEGLSLDELSSRLGISSASLSRIERGEQWPDRTLFERIASETSGRVTPDRILGLEDSRQ